MKQVNKRQVAKSFQRGKDTYDANATIQQRISKNLVDRLTNYPDVSYNNVFEIGCCTGNLTELLLKKFAIEKLYLNDLVTDFHQDVVKRVAALQSVEIIPKFGDVEQVYFPDKLSLVVSSATFQWLSDMQALFKKISQSLVRKGYLAFSIFGPGTLQEFKEVTGIGLEYKAVGTLLDMLEEDYHIEEEETVKDQLFFSTPREVLKHMQATGVGGVKEHRWTRGSLRQFEKDYYEKFGGASGVPVTYMSSLVIASKK